MTATVTNIADHVARPRQGQAARHPQSARQCAGVESGDIVTRDADTNKGSGVTPQTSGLNGPPPFPSSLVASINSAPSITVDGRTMYVLDGDVAWCDAIGWRWAPRIGAPGCDIWNPTLLAALDARHLNP